ncbi:MAG TPA: F0F1 ATP synthase subunit alpha [Geminicoccaceae bacterium]|nr:F0F1 ATP synthase subunit alpha [Geminicoccaceae bacterium]
MAGLQDSLERWLPRARTKIERYRSEARLEEIGRIERIGDGIATVSGLPDARLDELLRFADGTLGYAVDLRADEIGCVLLGRGDRLAAGDRVQATGQVLQVPVGEALLGRVLDPLGRPLDGGTEVVPERLDPVERPAPEIIERELVTEPLATGILVIDALFPLGRGQRELIVGDRATGKTAIAVDTIINQRRSNVICVYVAVGQKSSSVKQVIEAVRRHGAFERCMFVIAEPEFPAGLQWLAPYAGVTMAEYFRDRGGDALVVVDDLTKHAATHRELALLLRQPPGREAYPGDIFYVHARLLERAAKLSAERGGGSLTALPIAETQAGNLSAYIPTNLISITDGQCYLDAKLFHEGQKPSIDVGRSVSRVGGKTQPPALRELSVSLRLDYTQFLELEVFTRFGGMVDTRTRRTIERGRRIRGVLSQGQYQPQPLAVQIALLLALSEGLLDQLTLQRLAELRTRLPDWLAEHAAAAMHGIEQAGPLDEGARAALLSTLRDISAAVSSADAAGQTAEVER